MFCTEAHLATQAKAVSWPRRIARWLRSILLLIALALGIGWTLNRTEAALDRDASPAGLARGLLHGALMPLALPNLVIGRDVPIYASHNTGVSYKLGYTAGVNACGAIFFGCFYWRLHRLRKRSGPEAARPGVPAGPRGEP